MISIFFIALSLSMDAFSLSLAYGTGNVNHKNKLLLAILVGLFHFFMPMIGLNIGTFVFSIFPLKPNLIVFLILLFIGLQMIFESKKSKGEKKYLNLIAMLIFSFAVSVDSLSVGIGLGNITSFIFMSYVIFSLCSCFFTYLGLNLGNVLSNKFGLISPIIGGITLICIAFYYFFS